MKFLIRTTALAALLLSLAGCSGRSAGVDEPATGGPVDPPIVYEPTTASLKQHPVPQWWKDAKFGIFIHWGVYSVPAWANLNGTLNDVYAEWYWYWQQVPLTGQWLHHVQKYGTDFVYDDFIPLWKAENYDPQQWVAAFEDAGAKYFVLTTKHHDGIALWPSQASGRNTGQLGPKRDLVGELVEAAKGSSLKTGLYYSIEEWFNPAPKPQGTTLGSLLFFQPFKRASNAYTLMTVPYTGQQPGITDYAEGIVRPQLRELVYTYHPDIIWCDIGGTESYFRSNEFIADYYNKAQKTNPEGVIVNDRCGDSEEPTSLSETHYDYNTAEYGGGSTEPPFEATQGMGHSFGYNAEEGEGYLESVESLLDRLITNTSLGGNFLLNVGPKADGTIPQPMLDRLAGMGRWLRLNGEAIYASTTWTKADDGGSNHFTVGKDGSLYIIATEWPGQTLSVNATIPVTAASRITLLGSDGKALAYRQNGRRFEITTPAGGDQAKATSSEHAFVFRVTSIQ